MNCAEELTKDILFDCLDNPVKGIDKGKAVLINRNDIDFSRSKKEGATISDIYLKPQKRGYVVESGKNLASANTAFLPSTDDLEGFSHSFLGRIMTTAFESAERANELKQGRFIVVYQSRYKGIDNKEAFKVLGWEAGLMLTELKQNTAENRSSLLFTLSTEEGESESVPYLSFFDTNYYISNRLFEDKFRKNVLIEMRAEGVMDVSISNATGVEWEMYTGEVCTQNPEVPSGDINRPQIVFSEKGWVKLYVDDFSSATLDTNSTKEKIGGMVDNFAQVTYRLSIDLASNMKGNAKNLKATNWLRLFSCSNVDFDYSEGDREVVDLRVQNMNGVATSESAGYLFLTCYLNNANLTQSSIYNLIKFNYDKNRQNGLLDVTGINAIPDAATELLIVEMETSRGWNIATN